MFKSLYYTNGQIKFTATLHETHMNQILCTGERKYEIRVYQFVSCIVCIWGTFGTCAAPNLSAYRTDFFVRYLQKNFRQRSPYL